MKKPLIILTGPTAVGKTETSLQLAKTCGGEIISADSMQVYRHMDIGTAKLKAEDRQGIPHYMIDEYEPDEDFHVFLFQVKAKQYMEDIYSRGKLPILVGGTGFYIQSILYDVDFTREERDDGFRREMEEYARDRGVHALHLRLQEVDPESARAIHENNVKRVIRALEYHHLTGEKISEHNKAQRAKESPYRFLYIVLGMNREKLYDRIDRRVDEMMEQGLVSEVAWLLEQGYGRELTSMQGLGYKEIAAALQGEHSMEEAVRRLKRNTRHFAKRQMTWFRRERDVTMLDRDSFSCTEEIVEEIMKSAKKRGIV